jgi:hypothetical protein
MISDARLIAILSGVDGAISKARNLQPLFYTVNGSEDQRVYAGMTAQDVMTEMPEIVQPPTPEFPYYSYHQSELVALLVACIKELDQRLSLIDGGVTIEPTTVIGQAMFKEG